MRARRMSLVWMEPRAGPLFATGNSKIYAWAEWAFYVEPLAGRLLGGNKLQQAEPMRGFSHARAARNGSGRGGILPSEDGSLLEHVELPEVAAARAQERPNRDPPGLPDGSLEVVQLPEILPYRLVDGDLDAGRARDEETLGPERELQVNPHEAEHVGHDRPREPIQRGEEVPERSLLDVAALDGLEHLYVAVQARVQPVAHGPVALLEHEAHEKRHRDQDRRGGDQGIQDQLIEESVGGERQREAREEQRERSGSTPIRHGLRDDRDDGRG